MNLYRYTRALIGLFTIIILVLSLAIISMIVQQSNDDKALHSSEAAIKAECIRVNYLRWQDDRLRYNAWRRDSAAALLLEHGISPAVKITARVFEEAARGDTFLPYTNCRLAVSNPDRYRPPLAKSFTSYSQEEITQLLEHPDFGYGPQ